MHLRITAVSFFSIGSIENIENSRSTITPQLSKCVKFEAIRGD